VDIKSLTTVAPETIELGPLSFDLYAAAEKEQPVLFCRCGYEITPHHKEILETANLSYFIKRDEEEAYADYAFEHLGMIVRDDRLTLDERTEILHHVGLRVVKQFMHDPANKIAFRKAETVVEHYMDMVLHSSRAAANLFALTSQDPYAFSHSLNVASLNILLADLVFPQQRSIIWEAGIAGLLHDVGKTRITDSILSKPGPLTVFERREIQMHTLYGEEILQKQKFSADICAVCRSHHERWLGGGYPDGMKGNQIPTLARLTTVTDVYDAITSDRVYREAQRHLDALNEMSRESGHFDPQMFNTLLEVILRNEELVRRFKGGTDIHGVSLPA
jgi:putative nucleotidyltransferase with HDIG domain